MKERLNYIDYMKTSGIYLIVLGHMFPCPGTNFIYSFSVPLFFFISGFLFYQSDSFNTFLRKKFLFLNHSILIHQLYFTYFCYFFYFIFFLGKVSYKTTIRSTNWS